MVERSVNDAARGSLFRLLEQVHPRAVGRGDLRSRGVARDLLGAVVHQWVPEGGPADREAGEPGNARGGRQPLAHVLVVLATAQDDAADLVAAGAAGCGDDLLAILLPVHA